MLIVIVLSAVGGAAAWAMQGRAAAINPDRVLTLRDSAATTTTAASSAPAYRYIYNSDSAPAAVAAAGWNLIDVGSQFSADQLPAAAKGLLWVGDYDNSSCRWQVSDASLRSSVTAAVGDGKVFGYFFSDEPNPYACPNAPAQHKARNDLIHSIDATTQTVIVLDSNGFSGRASQDALDQLPLWKGTADVIGLDPYPCYQNTAVCDFSWIDKTIEAANAAGLNYWGVVQAFNDSSWRWPTSGELSHMLNQWGASKETGYMTFAWTWDGNALSSKPELLTLLQTFNNATVSPSDTTPPTAPSGLSKTGSTATSVSLAWFASTDNIGVAGYNVFNGNNLVASPASTSYTVGSLSCGTTYTFAVEAKDAAGNVSTRTTLATSTSGCPLDAASPTVPSALKSTAATTNSLSVSWTASTDNVGVASYGVYLNGSLAASTAQTNYTFSGLSCGTTYAVGVDAADPAGNRSSQAALWVATSACPDTLGPTAPVAVAITNTTQTSVTLSWEPSLDNVGVVGYDLYSNAAKAGSVAGASFTFIGLNCGTMYTFGVEAYDDAGNHSPRSTATAPTSACTASTGSPPTSPSKGCKVPKVIGSTMAAARAALARASCSVGKVSKRYAPRRKGRVIAQQPKPATRLANRARVNLVVSRGRRP